MVQETFPCYLLIVNSSTKMVLNPLDKKKSPFGPFYVEKYNYCLDVSLLLEESRKEREDGYFLS